MGLTLPHESKVAERVFSFGYPPLQPVFAAPRKRGSGRSASAEYLPSAGSQPAEPLSDMW